MAVGGLFSPVMRVLRCVGASRLAQNATGRQPTTAILYFRTGSEYSASQVTESTFLPSRGFRFVDLRPASSDGNICGFRQTGSGCLSTGSSLARPEVASSGPDTATPMTPSVKDFSVDSVSMTFVHIAGAHAYRDQAFRGDRYT